MITAHNRSRQLTFNNEKKEVQIFHSKIYFYQEQTSARYQSNAAMQIWAHASYIIAPPPPCQLVHLGRSICDMRICIARSSKLRVGYIIFALIRCTILPPNQAQGLSKNEGKFERVADIKA